MRNYFFKSLKAFGIVTAIAAVVQTLIGGGLLATRVAWVKSAVPVKAKITAVEVEEGRDSEGNKTSSTSITYTYASPLDGDPCTATKKLSSSFPTAVGDTLTTLVDPTTPTISRIDSFSELYMLPTFFIFFGVFWGIISAVLAFIISKLRRRMESEM